MKTRRQSIKRPNKRSKTTSENGKEDLSPLLPIDLVLEILSRLSAKSIARCRCVSKQWASILQRPYFTDLFLTKSSARPQILFACRQINCEESYGLFFYSSPQPQNPDENTSSLNAKLLTHFPLKGNRGLLITRIGGLIGFVDRQIFKKRMNAKQMFYNPITSRSLTLPKVKTLKNRVYNYFGYDPVEKLFKALSMTLARGRRVFGNFKVLTLGTEQPRWRMIECGVPHYTFCGEEICINGVIYYPAFHMPSEAIVIVCFDVRYEKFSYFKVVDAFGRGCVMRVGTLIDYNGKLSFLRSDVTGYYVEGRCKSLELIVIGDYEKQEWSKHTYMLPHSWKEMVGEAILTFVGVTRTNEIVLSHCGFNRFYLFFYHMERSTCTRVEIKDMNVGSISTCKIFLDHVEDLKFIWG